MILALWTTVAQINLSWHLSVTWRWRGWCWCCWCPRRGQWRCSPTLMTRRWRYGSARHKASSPASSPSASPRGHSASRWSVCWRPDQWSASLPRTAAAAWQPLWSHTSHRCLTNNIWQLRFSNNVNCYLVQGATPYWSIPACWQGAWSWPWTQSWTALCRWGSACRAQRGHCHCPGPRRTPGARRWRRRWRVSPCWAAERRTRSLPRPGTRGPGSGGAHSY